jgi:hypothetical protein
MHFRDSGTLFEAFVAAAADEPLRRFLQTHIHTAMRLEVLLVLREHREHPVSPAFLCEILGTTIDEAFQALEALCECGVALFCPGEDSRTYLYLSQGAAIESALEQLTYRTDRDGLSTITMRSVSEIERRGASIVYSFERPAARESGEQSTLLESTFLG